MSIISLRPVAAILAATLALACTVASAQEEEKVLNIYNWSDYIAEDTIKNFEKETGIKVRYDNFDNNEIVHAKLVAGKTGYDLVVPSSNWAKLQIDGGLLRKIDKAQLSNYKNLDPALQAQLARLDAGNDYMVNWLWGFTTVGINVDKVKAALGDLPMPDNVWDLVFKPEYVSKLKSCGVSFLDSATEVVPAALHYLGKPPFSKNPADYAAAAQVLKAVRPYITVFSSSGYINDLANGSICVALGWSGDINIAKPARHRRQDRQQHPGADPEERRSAVLRRDGHPGRCGAPGQRPQVHQLRAAPRGACLVDQQGLLRQPEPRIEEVHQARGGQQSDGVPAAGRHEEHGAPGGAEQRPAPADDAHLHHLQDRPVGREAAAHHGHSRTRRQARRSMRPSCTSTT